MWDCVHPGIPLVGRPRRLWSTSAETCSICPGDTSFGRRNCLQRGFSAPDHDRRNRDRVILTGADRFLQILDGMFLAAESGALLVMQPAKLLQNFCVIGVSVKNPSIRRLCRVILERRSAYSDQSSEERAHIFLLLVHMADLEPDVLFSKRSWRVGDYVLEALLEFSRVSTVHVTLSQVSHLQTLIIFLLLLVDDT